MYDSGMWRWALLCVTIPMILAGGQGSELLRSIRDAGLDHTECYRVRDISFARDEAQVFLTDGYLILGKSVQGRRMTAVFSAETEGGDAELLLLPPTHAERGALGKHTGTPNLEEHFTSAIFVFADGTEQELMEQIQANSFIKKTPEMGAILADKWASVVRNLDASFGLRLTMDLLSPGVARKGFFGAAFAGKRLGAFDLVFDSRSRESIVAGQSNGDGFDIWTSFVSRSFRTRKFAPEFRLSDYRIDSRIDPDLKIHCVTRLKLKPAADGEGALPFEISKQMELKSASMDGEAVELLTNPAPRSSIEGQYGNDLFVLVPARPLSKDKTYEVEVQYEGKVISDAGNKVYFVGSRGSWFPSREMQFSNFDLTFHYPKDLDLVASGDPVDERVEGETKVSHRTTQTPIRLAGFNLGVYDRETVKRLGLTIEICANKSLERALQAKPVQDPASLTGSVSARRTIRDAGMVQSFPLPSPAPSSSTARDRLKILATDFGDVMDFYASLFGPTNLRTLEVAPVPGRFGQGFPGLIYLSTSTYLQPGILDTRQKLFFTDLLHAHEAAHQWWGNVVTSAGYHDDWLMESLANYSALLYIEKKNGTKALDAVLQNYRSDLLAKPVLRPEQKAADVGDTVESSGPVVQGTRVDGSWNTVVYGKGSWIIHMLRRKMSDDSFLKMLGALRKEFEDKSISTEEFRLLCARFLPPHSADPKLEAFFDQWVYETGVPALKLEYKISGKAPLWRVTGTVTQSGVGEDFVTEAPVEIQLARLKPITVVVRASNEPVPFTATAKALPTKVAIDSRSVLLR